MESDITAGMVMEIELPATARTLRAVQRYLGTEADPTSVVQSMCEEAIAAGATHVQIKRGDGSGYWWVVALYRSASPPHGRSDAAIGGYTRGRAVLAFGEKLAVVAKDVFLALCGVDAPDVVAPDRARRDASKVFDLPAGENALASLQRFTATTKPDAVRAACEMGHREGYTHVFAIRDGETGEAMLMMGTLADDVHSNTNQ